MCINRDKHEVLSIELGHVMVGSDVFQQVRLESERLRQGGSFFSPVRETG